MAYWIIKNYVAPKMSLLTDSEEKVRAHAFYYEKCNFHCGFCCLRDQIRNVYNDFSEGEFALVVQLLKQDGNRFDFIGGEPTLNPTLERDMAIVKKLGGVTVLDTNGSNPEVLRRLLEKKLIDVLAFSIKGMSAEEAARVAEIKNTKLCWDNVLESIRLANEHPEVASILTVVFHESMDAREYLEKIRTLLKPFPNIHLKINNLQENPETAKRNLRAFDSDELGRELRAFVQRYPEFQGRITYEPTAAAIKQFDKLEYY